MWNDTLIIANDSDNAHISKDQDSTIQIHYQQHNFRCNNINWLQSESRADSQVIATILNRWVYLLSCCYDYHNGLQSILSNSR